MTKYSNEESVKEGYNENLNNFKSLAVFPCKYCQYICVQCLFTRVSVLMW